MNNNNVSDQDLYGFIGALTTRYIVNYYLNLEEKTFYSFGQEEAYEKECGQTGTFSTLKECFKKFIIEDDQPLLRQITRTEHIKQYLKDRNSYSIEVRDNASGKQRWLRCRITRGHDESHVALTLRDISEDVMLGEQTAEIIKKEQLLQRHLNVVGSLSLDYVNINYVDLTNGAYQELTSETLRNAEQLIDHFDDAHSKLVNMVMNYVKPEYQEELYNFIDLSTVAERLSDKDVISLQYQTNNIGWVEGSFIASRRDENGKCIRALWTVRSVDEQKVKDEQHRQDIEKRLAEIMELNKKLREEERERKTTYNIMDALSDSYHDVLLVDRFNRIAEVVKLSGYAPKMIDKEKPIPYNYDRLVAQYIDERVYPTDRAAVEQFLVFGNLLAGVDRGNFYELTYRIMQNGEKHYYQIRGKKLDRQYIVVGFQNIDVMIRTEKLRNEELERARKAAEAANNAKTSFLFNMSHDIRTPMNAIIGFRNLLEKHQDDVLKRSDYLAKIEGASAVLLSIINNVLEMARIEKGTVEIVETAWSAEQFYDSLYSVFHEMMDQKGITFKCTTNVENHYAYFDVSKMREIFINILSNSFKYTNTGGTVEMTLEELPSDREGFLVFRNTITDTGIGISEDYLPHIFEEFSRELNTTEGRIEGTGLGMPIVKRLVDLLGGTIEVQSKKGVGTTIVVTLPHRIAHKSSLTNHGGVEVDPKIFKNKRILLAEDNDLNAEIATEILQEVGFIIERAEDGQICVDKLMNSPMGYYDLVLMDIQMPNMNGYEAARNIRICPDSSKSNIPILAMTANAFEEDKREAMKAGMNGHLAKPIDVKALMHELASILS